MPMQDFLRDPFMGEFMKMLVNQQLQEKQVQRWLEKSLTEYEAWGGQQEKLGEAGLSRDITRWLMGLVGKGAEKLPRPGMAGIMRGREAGLELPGLADISPEQYDTAIAPIMEIIGKLGGRAEQSLVPTGEEAEMAARELGAKPTLDWYDKLIPERARKETDLIRWADIRERMGAGERKKKEITLRGKELEFEKGKEASPKALKTRLDKKIKERKSYIEKTLKGAEYYDIQESKPYFISEVMKISDEIKSIREKIGEPVKVPSRYEKIVSKLKSLGCTLQKLVTNTELHADLKTLGYSPWELIEYF